MKFYDRINELETLSQIEDQSTATIVEVKRNPKKTSLQTLAMKTVAIKKHLVKYEVSLKALSLNDV